MTAISHSAESTVVTTVHVKSNGNDSADGLTWNRPKATIASAIAALPTQSPSITAPGQNPLSFGVIQLDYGTITVASSQRIASSCGFTNGSAVVTDASATVDDVGAYVSLVPLQAFYGVRGSKIISVVPGVSFTMDHAANGTGTAPAKIDHPAIVLTPGVKLQGRGKLAGRGSNASDDLTNFATTIQDTGNGVTIWLDGDTALGETSGFELAELHVKGNTTNTIGLYGDSVNDVRINKCAFTQHGQWGIACGDQYYSAYWYFTDAIVQHNGTVSSTTATGGIALAGGGWTNLFENCHVNYNYGFNVYLANVIGNTFVNVDLNYALASACPYSGSCVYSDNSHLNSFNDAWFGAYTFAGVVYYQHGSSPLAGMGLDIQNSTFGSEGAGEVGIFTLGTSQAGTSISLRRCHFNANSGGWSIDNQPGHRIRWEDCTSLDSAGFIRQEALPAAAAPARGLVPRAPSPVALVSGTPWQNTLDSDVVISVPLTFAAGGTAAIARGPSSSAYQAAVLATSGIKRYYPLNESTAGLLAAELVGSHDGTYFAGPTLGQPAQDTTDTTASSVLFDGVDDRVTVTDVTGLPTGGAARSIEAWVRRTATGDMGIVDFQPSSGQRFALRAADNGGIFYTDGVTANNLTASSGWWPVNTWVHTVFTVDGSGNWQLIINGVVVQSGTFGTAVNTGTLTELDIGQANGTYFTGDLQEVAIYDVALSAATALAHHDATGMGSALLPLGTVTRQAADTDVLEYHVPAYWYFRVTLTNATFTSSATVQAI
ncbi:MAG: LamG domain-containing protein [Mycobacteriaceae bacterium]